MFPETKKLSINVISSLPLEFQRYFFKGFKSVYDIPHSDGGDTMIGAVVFVISFVLFLLISLAGVYLPPRTLDIRGVYSRNLPNRSDVWTTS